MLRIFTEQPDVGMIGVIGATRWHKDGIMWNAWDCGRTMGWNSLFVCLGRMTESSVYAKQKVKDQ